MTSSRVPFNANQATATSIAQQIDSPLMRSGDKELLSLALMDARNHTLHLFAQYQKLLERTNYVVPQLATVNPPLWELGHIGWFQEWWIARNMQRALGPNCAPAPVRLASIEPNADRWWDSTHVLHSTRWQLDLPNAQGIRAYLLTRWKAHWNCLKKRAAVMTRCTFIAWRFHMKTCTPRPSFTWPKLLA